LAALSEVVKQQDSLIVHTVIALAELDLAFAKAKYGEAIEAVEPLLFGLKEETKERVTGERQPTIANGALSFQLVAARHPLLDSQTVVPIDITLPAETRMLVITGPNTGGKTVSLKTVGLLTVMNQAGLRIPAAEGSTLPVFAQIFADIGDEQSIEQSLSTFSAHLTNIVQILADCNRNSLVIFDELGAGTDPIEGSALARAILSHLLEKQVPTFVATHFSELKAFAHTTPRVANASMEFDVESLAPTYRLQIGIPGASNAFAIAQRLGLSTEIIHQARGLIGENAQAVEAMLAEIRAQTEAAHQLRHQADQERAEAEAYKETVQKRLEEIDTERQDVLNSARADARREIKAVREKIRGLQEQAQQAIEQQTHLATAVPVAEAAQPVEAMPAIETELAKTEAELVAKATPSPSPKPKSGDGSLRPGDKVFISQFNTVGEVVEVQNKQVEVQLGHFRATVPLSEVELRHKKKEADAAEEKPKSSLRLPPAESPGMELDLRGEIAGEALLRLDQYLDQAFMARLPWVRIIHGKGSGTLRQVVRQELQGHPMVTSYRAGETGEGGDGVTVAKLAVN
jgi:DNA mismatch repair protein MutS2